MCRERITIALGIHWGLLFLSYVTGQFQILGKGISRVILYQCDSQCSSWVIYRGHFIDCTLVGNQYFIPFQFHWKHVCGHDSSYEAFKQVGKEISTSSQANITLHVATNKEKKNVFSKNSKRLRHEHTMTGPAVGSWMALSVWPQSERVRENQAKKELESYISTVMT